MNFVKIRPENKILEKFISHFFVIEVEFVNDTIPGVGKVTESIYIPGCSPEIIFNLSDESIFYRGHKCSTELKPLSSVIFGQLTRVVKMGYPSRTKFFGMRFKPYGLYPFFNNRIIKGLTDTISQSTSVFGEEFKAAANKLSRCSDINDYISVMTGLLLDRFDPERQPSEELIKIIDDFTRIETVSADIESLADHIGYTRQHFFFIFKAITGINPKTFQKLSRISLFRDAMNKGYSGPVLSFILSLGFFDQAHFSKEFKSIAGMTPQTYYKNNKKIVFK